MTKRRPLLPALLLGIYAVGLGCFDAVSPGGAASAALAIVPVFEGFSLMDGTPNDVDSFHITIVNPPNPDIVRGVRIAPGQDTIRLQIDLDITTTATVQVNFEGWSTATGLRLYSGTQSVTVSPGGRSEPPPVQAAYVGPGASIDSVVAAPPSATLLPGGTVQLTYTGFDANAALPDDSVPVWYQSSDSLVARVNRSGLVTAVAAGTANVFVTALANRSIRGTSAITVSAQPQPAIGLTPSAVSIPDTVSTTDPAPRTVSVSNSGGGSLTGLSVGTIAYGAGATGWLSASLSGSTAPATLTLQADNAGLQAGTYTATVPVLSSVASNTPQTVTVTYTLAAAGPASLKLTPGYMATQPGGTQALTVDVRDANNQTLPSTGTAFVSRSPAIATVHPTTGVVTALAPGHAVIVAALQGVSDSVVMSVAGTGSVVFVANGDGRAFDRVSIGDTVRVSVTILLAATPGEKLGSYTAQLNWAPGVLNYVRTDIVVGGFTAPVVNSTQAGSGQLTLGAADANGHSGPAVALATIVMVANAAGNTTLTGTVSDISASSPTFTNLRPAALLWFGSVRVQ